MAVSRATWHIDSVSMSDAAAPVTITGPLGPATLTIEFYINNVWLDVSDHVALSRGVTVRPAQRTDMNSDIEAGTAIFVLYCHDGIYWPDNPAGPYFGILAEGLICRVSATIGSTYRSIRHIGKIRLMEPELIGSVAKGAACTYTSSDLLTDLAGITMQDRLSENLRYYARPDVSTYTNGAQAWDSWPLTDDGTTNLVHSSRYAGNDGKVVPAKSGAGTVTFNTLDGASAKGPLGLPGMASFEPVSTIGPVLSLPVTGTTAGMIWMAFRTQLLQDATIAAGWDYIGNCMFRVRQTVANNLNLYDGGGTLLQTFNAGHFNDGTWHTLVFYVADGDLPGNQFPISVFGDDGTSVAIPFFFPGILRNLTVGGGMNPLLPGKQSSCWTGDATMLGVAGVAALGDLENRCAIYGDDPGFQFARTVGSYGAGFAGLGSYTAAVTSMDVANYPTQGLSVLQAAQTIARSTGAQLWVASGLGTTSGLFSMNLPEQPAPNFSPAFAVTLTGDDDGSLPMLRGADNAPTRTTASGPMSNATYAGDERLRRLDDSIDSFNTNQDDAYAVAGGWVNRPYGGRISPIGVDLATAQGSDALAVALLSAIPFTTVFTLANQPSELTGVTQADQILIGWEETYTDLHSVFALECMPAAQYPRGVFDADIGGRFAADGALTVTNGNSLATGTGSLTVNSTGPLMVTGVAVAWNWNGEVIVATASGSSTPQTLAVTARGQLGTVARTHHDGESIDVQVPAAFGY